MINNALKLNRSSSLRRANLEILKSTVEQNVIKTWLSKFSGR